ncbi:hypothetical protein D3C84_1127560 [compost metagenome]
MPSRTCSMLRSPAAMNALVHDFFAAARDASSGHAWRHAGQQLCSSRKTELITRAAASSSWRGACGWAATGTIAGSIRVAIA